MAHGKVRTGEEAEGSHVKNPFLMSPGFVVRSVLFIMCCVCVPECVSVHHVCCRCLWGPEKGVGAPGTELTGSCEFPGVSAGN